VTVAIEERPRVRAPVWVDRARGIAIGLAALTLIVRLVPAWLLKHEVADILTYRTMAEVVLRGDNIYAIRVLFPYTPFSQYLPAWELMFARATGLPFDFVAKIPPILADTGCTLLIFSFLRWRGLGLGPTVAWTALWVLNPVGILISAFHGNVMSVIPFLTLAAYVAAQRADKREDRTALLAISALLLGLAIAMRSFPILLVPPFLLLFCRTLREAAVYVVLVGLASLLSSLPYLIYVREPFLREALGYSGSEDFGWVAVVRAMYYFTDGQLLGVFAPHLVEMTKRLFLGAYLVSLLALPFSRRDALGRALLIPPLLFYGIYGGVSGQYLVWIVPMAIAIRERMVIPFTVVTAAALIAFYALYHQGILFGRNPPLILHSPTVTAWYVGGNVAVVVLSWFWTLRIILLEVMAYRRQREALPEGWVRGLEPLRRSPLYAGLLIALGVGWLYVASRVVGEARTILLLMFE
jgi:hypothetical protein